LEFDIVELAPFSIATSRLTLAGLKNSVQSGVPVIALHGWLDNAASFIPLGNELNLDNPFYAVEMPGHGWSEHRSSGSSYHLVENVVDIAAFVEEVISRHYDPTEQASAKVILLGHSLGGIVSSFLAASQPERVAQLILLDSLGPLTDDIQNVLPQLRKAVAKASRVSNSTMTVYPDKEKAVKVRMLGIGRVNSSAASLLVDRGMKAVEGGFVWRSDSKLLAPSMVRFTESQVEAILAGIECPVHLMCGDKGYFSSHAQIKRRIDYFKTVTKYDIEGGHHFHMDGDVTKTAELIDAIVKVS
jgi:pimeloyl-ACP methyl ester carboxylesterase